MRIPISMKVESDNSRWNVFFFFCAKLRANAAHIHHIRQSKLYISCSGCWACACVMPAACLPDSVFTQFFSLPCSTNPERKELPHKHTYVRRCKRAPWICFHISHTVQNAVCEKLALRERTVTRPQSSMCFFTVVFLLSNKNMEFSDHKNFASLPRADKLHHRLLSEIQRNAYSLKLTEFTSKVRK